MKPEELEKYTSAITLSDMEVFVFPELIYALVLANIMSPVIWRWRDEKSFKKLADKDPYKKLMRLRQYIMDQYEFNLDLETWGLTDKAEELKRFEKFIKPEDIAGSNALFGYQGDKYYFDVDIRRHFGLDKYDDELIPYWKTETVEAMDAFSLKKGYTKKAGECVSLSTLYATAAFIVCGIPLEDIFLILTPLHSQNFIDIKEGVLTNNRRLVTKAMWFNGTAISAKAQRALRNEQVTVVAHSSGYIHCLYDSATINRQAYEHFSARLSRYLSTPLDKLIITNFLRAHSQYQKHFQFCRQYRGEKKFVKAETLFQYEHGSNFRIADETFEKLLAEVSDEDFSRYKLPDRICCEQLQSFISYEKLDIQTKKGIELLKNYLQPFVPDIEDFIDYLTTFTYTQPRLTSSQKTYTTSEPITLSADQSREQIIEYLHSIRQTNKIADLAFYAYRDMQTCNPLPFIKAAVERNPVSIQMAESMSIEQVYAWLNTIKNTSIYDGKRLATPDEVTNYKTGDGLEKAFLLANVIRQRDPDRDIEIITDSSSVILKARTEYKFVSEKNLTNQLRIPH